MINLETELARIRGLNQSFIAKLAKLNLLTIRDLLFYFPTRYDDFSKIVPIAELAEGRSVTVSGTVRKIELRRTWKKHMTIVEALIADESGGIKAIWFNQPYVARMLRPGIRANFAGKVAYGEGSLYLSNPAHELMNSYSETAHTGRLVPIYPETKGLTSRGIRYLMRPVLKVIPPIPEFIPREILAARRLPETNTALRNIHFPRKIEDAELARRRFAFESLFLLQLGNIKARSALAQENAHPITLSSENFKMLTGNLPFALTPSQQESLDEILGNISRNRPMNRLLQGDVGSGKTVVAAIAAIAAAKNGFQAAFMAPTEVLARQHHATIQKLFGGVLEEWQIETDLLLGSFPSQTKKKVAGEAVSGKAAVFIGTHALIQKSIKFKSLALVIVDEQHRFGVQQRADLVAHGQTEHAFLPHFLSMSATPIPRTLSLTLFGDLDISIINELPKGRGSILTKAVTPENRTKAYTFAREQIKKGRQAFVICPRIEMGDGKWEMGTEESREKIKKNILASRFSSLASQVEVKAVKAEFEKLSKEIFPDLKIGMLHGKLKTKEKEQVMLEFKEGMIDILVSTSVVEVGVDVPNATVMIIEGAERFGLSQLYQFRGRIGRGEHLSFCLLFAESSGESSRERLNALLSAKNGFELAELDLKLRGPGEFLGGKQTGLPDTAMRALSDMELVKESRAAAEKILIHDPELAGAPLLLEKLKSFQKSVHLE